MSKGKISILHIVIFPFTFFYWLIISIRNVLFDLGFLRSTEFKLPVISVGNITVGGTGKTPHIEYLVDLLGKEKRSIAVLSRGYRRKTRKFIIADDHSRVSDIGDEPKQLKKKFPGLIVAVDRKRVQGIKELLKLEQAPEIVLLDDAFQHRYVKPGMSILLVDYNRLITEDNLLPAGRLREPVSAMKRADIILVTKSPPSITLSDMQSIEKKLNIGSDQFLLFTIIAYGEPQPVFQSSLSIKPEKMIQNAGSLILVTGIANPDPLRNYALKISPELDELRFPDHHSYTLSDIAKIQRKLKSMPGKDPIVLTTEKDAMRIMEMKIDKKLRDVLFYVPITVKFVANQNMKFDQILLDYVRKN